MGYSFFRLLRLMYVSLLYKTPTAGLYIIVLCGIKNRTRKVTRKQLKTSKTCFRTKWLWGGNIDQLLKATQRLPYQYCCCGWYDLEAISISSFGATLLSCHRYQPPHNTSRFVTNYKTVAPQRKESCLVVRTCPHNLHNSNPIPQQLQKLNEMLNEILMELD